MGENRDVSQDAKLIEYLRSNAFSVQYHSSAV
jgi:hypothetical protein